MNKTERKRILEGLGFVLVRTTGRHAVYRHPEKGTMAILPSSRKDGDMRGWKNERARLRREGFDVD